MKITDIKQQVKRQNRYSIFVDEKYLFSLSENELINSGLRVGRELSQAELSGLKYESELGKVYERALNLISHRPRSEGELRDYMKRKGHDEAAISQVIERLSERSYINDADFARRWVEYRRMLKSSSKRRLMQELRQKHISDDIIHQVLSDDEINDQQALRELVEKKRRQSKYKDDQKLMQYLSRQGFNYDDIKAALQEE